MNKDLYANALKALACDHTEIIIIYKEYGWDDLTHSPTGVHAVCEKCGMETDEVVTCLAVYTNYDLSESHCDKIATRVIGGMPFCDNCKIEFDSPYVPEAVEPNDDYDGVEYG